MRIHLIDNEPIVLSTLSNFLRDLGHSVTCSTSKEGLETITNEPCIDLVITDLQMPEADGLRQIRLIRELLPGTPIVIISGHAGIHQKLRKDIENETYAFLRKPFGLNELEYLLARLSKKRLGENLKIASNEGSSWRP